MRQAGCSISSMRDYHRSVCCSILLTLSLVSLLSTSPAYAMDCTNQSPSRMNVCELFAGIAVMSAVLQSIGWNVSMLCESNTALASFLKLRFPGADVQLNVEDILLGKTSLHANPEFRTRGVCERAPMWRGNA